MHLLVCLLTILGSTAHAIPAQFTHQGRLLAADGTPMEGEIEITFRLADAPESGDTIWEESLTVSVTNGFYTTTLGTDEVSNPLNTEVLDQAPLWLELQLTGEDAMSPRTAVNTVPYANMAVVAEEVNGGPVDASEVSISGALVIDADGEWVGPTSPVTWSAIEGIPADIVDGDDADSLAATICTDGQILVYDLSTSAWACGTDTDTNLTATEVRAMVESVSGIALLAGATVDGSAVLTEADHGTHTDAHHSSTSDGLDITPSSVAIQGTDTVLNDGSIDLGSAADDVLAASMVQTLTGGGDADSLHTHAAADGGGGACYTVKGTTACAPGFDSVMTGAMMHIYGQSQTPSCLDKSNLTLLTSWISDPTVYTATATGWSRYNIDSGEIECAICCSN